MSKRKKKKIPSNVAAPVELEVAAPVESEVVAPVKAEITVPVALAEPFDCPAISVVIPMYNAEKFITECLESLLAQTFTNFEVIIVDDCSTDNSTAIVESYAEKFGGRLKLSHMKKNSGSAGIPRNTGITLARGEYIRFADADDILLKTALEEDFSLAKKYNADVVYHTLFYKLNVNGIEGELASVPKYQPGDEIVLDEDLPTRIRELAGNKYYHAPWRSFSRRDFLIANELYFPNIRSQEDIVWNYALLIYAERFLQVPSAVYFYRDNKESLSRKEKTAAQNAKFYLNPIIFGLKSLNEFINRHKFFETEPELHYALLENYFNSQVYHFFRNASEMSSSEFYAILKEVFGKDLDDFDVLIPALCAALAQQQKITAVILNQFREYVAQAEQKIIKFQNEINQRKNNR